MHPLIQNEDNKIIAFNTKCVPWKDTWNSFFGRCSWMSLMSTLTGSGSASLDGIPGSLDGLHKTSRNSLMKDLVVVDDPTLSSAVGCL